MESRTTLEDIEIAAATWILRQEGSEWSGAQSAELDAWLAQSPGHRVAYLRLKSAWSNSDRLKSIASGVPKGRVPAPGALMETPYFTLKRGDPDPDPTSAGLSAQGMSQGKSVHSRARVRVLAFAASLIVVVGLGVVAYTTGLLGNGARYTTPVGGRTTVPTADGSTITLNTDTDIRVQMTEHERRIELRRGEAFFEVARDVSRPFVVYADNQRIVAVGTKFSVRKERDSVRVAVTEGAVRVDGTAVDPSPTATRPDVLPAGSTANISEQDIQVKRLPIPDIEESLSWRSGSVVLRRTPLSNAIDEFNRYSTRKLVLEDPELAAVTVGGNFRTNNVDGFIRLLEQGFDIEATERDGEIHLARKRP